MVESERLDHTLNTVSLFNQRSETFGTVPFIHTGTGPPQNSQYIRRIQKPQISRPLLSRNDYKTGLLA